MKAFKTIFIIAIFVITAGVIAYFAGKRFGIFGNVGESVSDKITTGAFTSISVDADVANFSIEEGEEYAVEYTYPSNMIPTVKVNGDTLEINVHPKKGTGFINLNTGETADVKTKLTVIVPEGSTAFDSLNVKADAGNITLDGYTFDALDIDCDAANVNIKKVTSGKTKIDADAGNVQIRDSKLGDSDLQADAGNIDIEDTEVGNITIDTNMGNIDLQKTIFGDGNFTSDMGRISIDGTFDKVKADSDMGAISVDSDTIDDAELDLNVSLGGITVDGKSKGKSYKQNAK